MVTVDEHFRAVVIQPTIVNSMVVLEVKCLMHPETVLGVFNTDRVNAWWSVVDGIVREHMSWRN